MAKIRQQGISKSEVSKSKLTYAYEPMVKEERETKASKKKGKSPMVEEPYPKNLHLKKAKVVEKHKFINKNHPLFNFKGNEETLKGLKTC